MCNLYRQTKGQASIIALTRALRNSTGNLPPLPGIFPDFMAPIVRNTADGVRELAMARRGYAGATGVRRGTCHEHPQREVAAPAGLAQAGGSSAI
jgi:putative SOS response-associated peptidase YedK